MWSSTPPPPQSRFRGEIFHTADALLHERIFIPANPKISETGQNGGKLQQQKRAILDFDIQIYRHKFAKTGIHGN